MKRKGKKEDRGGESGKEAEEEGEKNMETEGGIEEKDREKEVKIPINVVDSRYIPTTGSQKSKLYQLSEISVARKTPKEPAVKGDKSTYRVRTYVKTKQKQLWTVIKKRNFPLGINHTHI